MAMCPISAQELNSTDQALLAAIQRLTDSLDDALPQLNIQRLTDFFQVNTFATQMSYLLLAPDRFETEHWGHWLSQLRQHHPKVTLCVLRDWHFSLYHSQWILLTYQTQDVQHIKFAVRDVTVKQLDPLWLATQQLTVRLQYIASEKRVTFLEKELENARQDLSQARHALLDTREELDMLQQVTGKELITLQQERDQYGRTIVALQHKIHQDRKGRSWFSRFYRELGRIERKWRHVRYRLTGFKENRVSSTVSIQ